MKATSKVLPKAPLLLVSLLLSIMLWLYVQVQEHPIKPPPSSYEVEIKLRDVPAGLVATNPGKMRFFPKGSLEDLQMINAKDLSAYVDMSEAAVGTQTYPVHFTYRGDASVIWQPAKPQARITVERKLTMSVQVRVQPSGELESADYLYLPESTRTTPTFVEISGPESAVQKVKAARAILDLTQVEPGQTYDSAIELLEEDERPAAETVQTDVKKVVIQPAILVGLQSLRLPVRASYVGKPAPGFVVKELIVSPRDLQVRGDPELLNNMTYLETEPKIDVTGLDRPLYFTVTPKLPPQGIAISGQPTVTVQVVIEPAPKPPATTPSSRRRAGQ